MHLHHYLGIGWLIFGIIGAWIATSKGRGGCLWFALCGIFGPIGLIVVALLPVSDG